MFTGTIEKIQYTTKQNGTYKKKQFKLKCQRTLSTKCSFNYLEHKIFQKNNYNLALTTSRQHIAIPSLQNEPFIFK
jgi:hypothetical protein